MFVCVVCVREKVDCSKTGTLIKLAVTVRLLVPALFLCCL